MSSQTTTHPRPPSSNVLADADSTRTLLVKPGDTFNASSHGLRGDTDDP
jgi:hypothetical protein